MKPVPISHGRSRIHLLHLTELGSQILRDHGHIPRILSRRGSLEHQYWYHQSKIHYEKKGYGVLEELPLGNGKTVDLVAIKGKEKIAIEVETGKSDVVGNIRKCLAGSFTKIVVLATSTKARARIHHLLNRNDIRANEIVMSDVSYLLPLHSRKAH